MFKHYIGVILLGITGVIVIIIGIILVGSPSDQQLLRFDEIRLKDFENIQPPIENFYSDNKKLPQSLTALNTTLTFKDPQSKKDYTYKTISPTSYQLCAEFSTDSKEVAQRQTGTNPYAYNSYGSATKLHKKGYDCIKYQISSYLIQNLNNYPPPTPTIASQQNYFQFLKPIPDQTLCLGQTYEIEWEADNSIKDVHLYLNSSTNAVDSFKLNPDTIVAASPREAQNYSDKWKGSLRWTVGQITPDNPNYLLPLKPGKYRFVENINKYISSLYAVYSDTFNISDCSETAPKISR